MIPAVLVAGRVSRGPERRQKPDGKSFVALILRVEAAGKASERWRIFAFAPTVQAALADLKVGDDVAIAGALRVSIAEESLLFSITAFKAQLLGPNDRARLSLTVEPANDGGRS